MEFWYVYVLQSNKDGKFYTGVTKDLKVRFDEHMKGKVESAKDRRPLKVVYYEASNSKKDAMHRETYLKTTHGKRYIKNRIKSYLTGS